MAFWTSEKLKDKANQQTLIAPYDESRVKHGAYELSLGNEAFITSDDTQKKQILQDGEQLLIPPGQLALLITKEEVRIPPDTIGFISIKAGIKFSGLVNVSGFHVDPGFSGKLKFSVYNAGSRNTVLSSGQNVFLLWFSELDRATSDTYKGEHSSQKEITSQDVMKIQGEVHSPAALDKRLTDLESSFDKRMADIESVVSTTKTIAMTIAGGLVIATIIFIANHFWDYGRSPSSAQSGTDLRKNVVESPLSDKPSNAEKNSILPPKKPLMMDRQSSEPGKSAESTQQKLDPSTERSRETNSKKGDQSHSNKQNIQVGK